MSKKVYFVHEEDEHASYDSMVIKMASPFRRDANNFFEEFKENYLEEGDWNLVMSYYEPSEKTTHENNILRDLVKIKSTENG